jgi:hypothetical protein
MDSVDQRSITPLNVLRRPRTFSNVRERFAPQDRAELLTLRSQVAELRSTVKLLQWAADHGTLAPGVCVCVCVSVCECVCVCVCLSSVFSRISVWRCAVARKCAAHYCALMAIHNVISTHAFHLSTPTCTLNVLV